MDHIQDVYKKKPDMINKIWDHLTKVNLKVDGKPFQVVYNEDEDELEYHGRSGNETKVGPLIDDMYRLFSKPINDAIRHIENRVEVFKRYKFLTFEVIDEILLLTAIITKEGKFVDDPDEIDEIAKELDTDVMPCLWKGKLFDEQRDVLMTAISTDIVPTKDGFIKWVKDLFGTYKKFPKTLISRSTEFIEGIVFFYDVDGKVVEYKLVDPSFRQMVKDNHANMKQDGIENAEKYTEIYTSFLEWAEENAKGLDKNRMRSIEFNFIEMMKDPKIYNKLMKEGAGLTTITTDAYFLQPDRISDELKKAIKKHGKVYQLLYEKFVRLFYKAKKRGFVLSKEFQARVNKAVDKFADYSLNEDEIEIDGELLFEDKSIEWKDITGIVKNSLGLFRGKKPLEYIAANFGEDDATFVYLVKALFDDSEYKKQKQHINELSLNDLYNITKSMRTLKNVNIDNTPNVYGTKIASGKYNSIKITINNVSFYITNRNAKNAGLAYEKKLLENLKSIGGLFKDLSTLDPKEIESSLKNFIADDENNNAKTMAANIINQLFKVDSYKELLFNSLKNNGEDAIIGSGGKKTKRNEDNQIINKNTLEVNIKDVEKTLIESGEIISDITIKLNNSEIYISVKDNEAQLSGITLSAPFYDNDFPKWVNEHKNEINLNIENIINNDKVNNLPENGINLEAFKNLCKLMGVNDSDQNRVFYYFTLDESERKKKFIKLQKNKTDKDKLEIIKSLIKLLIGANYWYVNSNGKIYYISPTIENDKMFNIEDGENIYLNTHLIKSEFKIIGQSGKKLKCELVFRTSGGQGKYSDGYPYRLFVKFSNFKDTSDESTNNDKEYFLETLFGKQDEKINIE